MNWDNRLRDIANKHGFSEEAAAFMAQTIRQAGGRFAQWNHPQLGGFGQWIPGLTTLSPRDPATEKRLDELCQDLLGLLKEDGHTEVPGQDGTVWWPKTLGFRPDSAGGQNRVRYAYFADVRRLAVDRGDGQVTVYDTGEHHVHGVSQRQGSSSSDQIVFQSQRGEVDLDTLAVVEPPGD